MMESDGITLAVLTAALAAAGLLAGLIAGLLGVGGGIVIVPVLFHLLPLVGVDDSVRMHTAVGTSLASIVVTSFYSARAHYRRGVVDVGLLRTWGPFIGLGALIGTALAGAVQGAFLTGFFGVFALCVAVQMLLSPEVSRFHLNLPAGWARALTAALIGAVSSMLGIGGGTLSVPILSACGYPMIRAVGTAAAFGAAIALPGAIGFAVSGWNAPSLPPFSLGYVNLLSFAVIVPMTMTAAPWGARLAHTASPQVLKRVFAVFLLLTAMRMLARLF